MEHNCFRLTLINTRIDVAAGGAEINAHHHRGWPRRLGERRHLQEQEPARQFFALVRGAKVWRFTDQRFRIGIRAVELKPPAVKQVLAVLGRLTLSAARPWVYRQLLLLGGPQLKGVVSLPIDSL